MALYFLDSSAIAKRYIPETGSTWIRQLTDPNGQNDLFIARITWVEVLSALARRQREGLLTSDAVNQITTVFATHLDQQYRILEIDRTLANLAGDLVAHIPCVPMMLSNSPLLFASKPLSINPNFWS